MDLVVDASVALKWFFQTRDDEHSIDQALAILDALDRRTIRMVQPPHFLAEMAAVLIREKGEAAYQDVADLRALDWITLDDPALYKDAMALSARFQHHLFDTLYHAVALQGREGVLVTADRRYYDKASAHGAIHLLGANAPWLN